MNLTINKIDKDKALDILTVVAAVTAVALAVAAVFHLLWQFCSAMKEIRLTMPFVRKAAEIYIDERTAEKDDMLIELEDLMAEEGIEDELMAEEMMRSVSEELEEAMYL